MFSRGPSNFPMQLETTKLSARNLNGSPRHGTFDCLNLAKSCLSDIFLRFGCVFNRLWSHLVCNLVLQFGHLGIVSRVDPLDGMD